MAELTVANTYAAALFGAAKDAEKTDAILEEFKEIMNILETEMDFKTLLSSPAIAPRDKKQVIKNVFEGRLTEELVSFLCILIDKGRMSQLDRIARRYEYLVNEDEGFSLGIIYSAVPLKEDQIDKFQQETSNLLKQNIKLNNKIDKTLIGGVKIYVEGKMIDASLKTRLDKILTTITK